jgi:hypothetical protein
MDAYIPALMGLAGVAIGSLTSFATTWMTQRSQVKEHHREVEVAKREKLFRISSQRPPGFTETP